MKGILKAADDRRETLSVRSGQKVHTICRKQYTNPNVLLAKRKERCEPNEKVNLRSEELFSFKEDCLFCGRSIKETCRQRQFIEHYQVRTKDFQTAIQVNA